MIDILKYWSLFWTGAVILSIVSYFNGTEFAPLYYFGTVAWTLVGIAAYNTRDSFTFKNQLGDCFRLQPIWIPVFLLFSGYYIFAGIVFLVYVILFVALFWVVKREEKKSKKKRYFTDQELKDNVYKRMYGDD